MSKSRAIKHLFPAVSFSFIIIHSFNFLHISTVPHR